MPEPTRYFGFVERVMKVGGSGEEHWYWQPVFAIEIIRDRQQIIKVIWRGLLHTSVNTAALELATYMAEQKEAGQPIN